MSKRLQRRARPLPCTGAQGSIRAPSALASLAPGKSVSEASKPRVGSKRRVEQLTSCRLDWLPCPAAIIPMGGWKNPYRPKQTRLGVNPEF